jgi:hypothetical protein
MKRIKAYSVIVVFVAAVFADFGFSTEARGSEFFLLAGPTSPEAGHFAGGGKQSLPANFPAAKRFRSVEVTPSIATGAGVARGDTIILNLFDDTSYTASIDRISSNINGTVSVRGRLDGYPLAEVIISTTAGRSLASIRIPETGEHYLIQSEPDTASHYLLDLDVEKLVELEDAPPLIPSAGITRETEESQGLKDTIVNGPLDPVNIDIMIVYTPAARSWADSSGGGIDNVIADAMERAQLALDNSNTILTMTLVYSSEISYTESGSSSTDLNRLTYNSDGYLDAVHTWRDEYGADLVALFTYVEDTGGISWLLNSTSGSPSYGFSISRVQQAGWTYTTVHELGHNMGCHHHKQQFVQPGPGLFSYSAGWRWVGTDSGKYCSVMTYENGSYFPDGQTHTRVGHFSNPSISYQGVATGHSADGDNARTIREVKDVVSAYRTDIRDCDECVPEDVYLGTIGVTVWGYSVSGNCGNGGKWVGRFTGEAGKTYHFDLCPDSLGSGTANFDADIKITNSSCGILTGQDGVCTSPSYVPNDFQWTCPSNGTYYVIIAPYYSYNSHNCGGDSSDTFTLKYYKNRPCEDCEPEDAYLGTIGTTVWGYSVSGNCGNGGKWVGQFNGEADSIYHFDLCPDSPGSGTANFNADIKITNSSCAILAGENGTCTSPSYVPNDFSWICSSSGTYYVIIAPYSSYNSHNCTGTASNTFTMKYYKVSTDTTAPVPNPMEWSTDPYETSTSSITMVAVTATDASPPVYYQFDFYASPTGGSGGTDSDWQTSPTYTDNDLQANHVYGYCVRARDSAPAQNTGSYSTPPVYDFTDIETPSGITFGTITATSIEAKSTNTPSGLARVDSGLRIYNTTMGTDSGWKKNNNYWNSTGLSVNTQYSFKAKARNGDADETPDSPTAYKYTYANPPAAAPFSNVTQTSIQANWTANGNPAGTQYLCENTTLGTNSGWTSNTYWNESGLSCSTQYCYQTRARNGDGVETTPTSLGCQSTLPPMDLNNDGIVDFGDFAIFAFYWMDNTCAEPDWCEGGDSDHSGRVDCVDLLNFADCWLCELI